MNGQKSVAGGVILIVLGTIFLLDQFFPNLSFGKLWPLILIGIGVSMVWDRMRS
jgi:putative Mn2+ efflux pump MntP